MQYLRTVKSRILNSVQPGKVFILLGARRVGKTFLLRQLLDELPGKHLLLNGEDIAVHDQLKRRSVQNYKSLLGDVDNLIIDEAQKIPDIGLILKLIVDSFPELIIFVTGSSAFDISNLTGEPLTGRKRTFNLFPLSELEFTQSETMIERYDSLKERLIFGNYPEVANFKNRTDKIEYLKEIINSYLLKDILMFDLIKNSSKLFDLLKSIALQLGNEVSYEELGGQLSISKSTVEKYLDLLSKVFVIHKLTGFSRNLRKEIVKKPKFFFFDNGIRNAIINNFNPLDNRNDVEALWENYMISERIKFQNYKPLYANNYFWRTYDRQEIDWVEEREGNLFAYEFKWKQKKSKVPMAFAKAYPQAEFCTITNENYSPFLGLTYN